MSGARRFSSPRSALPRRFSSRCRALPQTHAACAGSAAGAPLRPALRPLFPQRSGPSPHPPTRRSRRQPPEPAGARATPTAPCALTFHGPRLSARAQGAPGRRSGALSPQAHADRGSTRSHPCGTQQGGGASSPKGLLAAPRATANTPGPASEEREEDWCCAALRGEEEGHARARTSLPTSGLTRTATRSDCGGAWRPGVRASAREASLGARAQPGGRCRGGRRATAVARVGARTFCCVCLGGRRKPLVFMWRWGDIPAPPGAVQQRGCRVLPRARPRAAQTGLAPCSRSGCAGGAAEASKGVERGGGWVGQQLAGTPAARPPARGAARARAKAAPTAKIWGRGRPPPSPRTPPLGRGHAPCVSY